MVVVVYGKRRRPVEFKSGSTPKEDSKKAANGGD